MTIARITEGHNFETITCKPGDSVQKAAGLLAKNRIGALPVIENNKVAGIFSERDLLYCIAREGAEALDRSIAEVMTAPAISVDQTTSVDEALSLMTRRRIRHLPVIDNEALTGFVSIGDIVKFRLQAIEQEAEQMRDYIAQ